MIEQFHKGRGQPIVDDGDWADTYAACPICGKSFDKGLYNYRKIYCSKSCQNKALNSRKRGTPLSGFSASGASPSR